MAGHCVPLFSHLIFSKAWYEYKRISGENGGVFGGFMWNIWKHLLICILF